MHLFELIVRFKKKMFVVFTLIMIEHIAWIIEPAVFGTVIDVLIDRAANKQAGFTLLRLTPLFIWIALYGINSGAGVLRRIVDQRIFLNMYTQIATEISQKAKESNYSVSKTAALSQLSEGYITFFQYRLPEMLEQIIAIGGAVIALAAFDWRISVTCLSIVAPLFFINIIYNKKVGILQKEFHDLYEGTFDVFSTQNPEEVRNYYQRSAKSQQRIANWGALNFGVMRSALLIIFLVVLYIAIDLDEFTTGNIYSIVAYIWTFITSSEYLPELMESWTSIKDISGRLKTETI
jgi:ABC-type multidrug transport system fused ATPase/permease subunit